MDKIKSDNRVFFPGGEQSRFIFNICKNCDLGLTQLAGVIGVHRRTLFDWRREKYSISLKSLKIMCRISKLIVPKNIELRESTWFVKAAARLGGKAVYRKYGSIGNPDIRKKKWQDWWENKGKFNPNRYFITREINIPKKSLELAEFVGIMLGDGGITERQVTITLNINNDKLYSNFVRKLIKNLFEVRSSVYLRKKDSTIRVTVSRKRLVNYCQSIGLKVGNKLKQNLDVPKWIIENSLYYAACIRGLFDTDGCIFYECHKIKGKKYFYPRISLVSASKTLREDVYKMLIDLRFLPVIRNNRSVQLEKKEEIEKYFKVIGTHNPHHYKRYNNHHQQ